MINKPKIIMHQNRKWNFYFLIQTKKFGTFKHKFNQSKQISRHLNKILNIQKKLRTFKTNFGTFKKIFYHSKQISGHSNKILNIQTNFDHSKQILGHSNKIWNYLRQILGHSNKISIIQNKFWDIQTKFRSFKTNFETFKLNFEHSKTKFEKIHKINCELLKRQCYINILSIIHIKIFLFLRFLKEFFSIMLKKLVSDKRIFLFSICFCFK